MISCPLDGKFVMADQATGHSAPYDRPCDSLTNDLSSVAASGNFLLNDELPYRTSTIASGCSAPQKLDLYHDCSREPSAGGCLSRSWPTASRGFTLSLVPARPMMASHIFIIYFYYGGSTLLLISDHRWEALDLFMHLFLMNSFSFYSVLFVFRGVFSY